MSSETCHEFVVSCDGTPRRLIVLRPSRVARLCALLRRFYPSHEWSIKDRFLPEGAD